MISRLSSVFLCSDYFLLSYNISSPSDYYPFLSTEWHIISNSINFLHILVN
uniref:Uncharacterized protein n=1 Tax=Octopus bimaculoides TaxID=37653 RepID=A0A0L8I9Y2_OCTBM